MYYLKVKNIVYATGQKKKRRLNK